MIPCLKLGGTELQTLNLVKALHTSVNRITVLCYFEFERIVVKDFELSGAEVVMLKWRRGIHALNFINSLRIEIRKIKPDVVHVQYMAPGALPIIAARLAGVRTVFATVHQPYTKTHRWFVKLILRMASLLCTKFIAVSVNAEKSWFGCGQLFDENKPLRLQPGHFTIYNSIDNLRIQNITRSIIAERLKQELAIPVGIPVIGAISRLSFEKGIDLLIDSCRLLIESKYNLHLLIVGSGPDGEKLKKQVQNYKLESYVTFCGRADWEKAMQLMSIMDIVAVPSRFEGFGLTAAEAMAAGKSVIACDIFGLKEVVVDKVTGLTFKAEDISEMEQSLKILLSNTVLCSQYGVAGQERARALFDISLFQKKVAALYN